jgi:hypothetical protein
MGLDTTSIVVGIISSILSSLLGALGGGRIVWFAIERKLDDRYMKKPHEPEDRYVTMKVLNGWGDRVKTVEGTVQQNVEKFHEVTRLLDTRKHEHDTLSKHVNESVIKMVEQVSEDLREIRDKNERYLQVQSDHASTMREHARALQAFQQWVMQVTGGKFPMFPLDPGK